MYKVIEVTLTGMATVGIFPSRQIAQLFILECIEIRECGSFYVVNVV